MVIFICFAIFGWLVVWNSRGLYTYQQVRPCPADRRAFCSPFRAMDLIMDLADVDTGGRFSAVVKVVVFGPAHERHLVRSVLTGSILVLGGLFDGASDVLTLLDVVLVQLFSIPSLKVDDVTRVLYHLQHTWEDFFKLVDACCGLVEMTHGAHAIGMQTMVAVDSDAPLVDLHMVHGGCEYVIGDVGCPQVIAEVWSKRNHAAVMSAGVSCQPCSQLGDRKGGADPRALSLPNILRAALFLCIQVLVLECVVPACSDPFVSQHLDRFVELSGIVKENINLELMQKQTQIDGQFREFTHHQSQQVSNLQAQMQAQSPQLHGQIKTQNQNKQAMLENQLSHIRGLLQKRPRDDGEWWGGHELPCSHSGTMMMGSCCAVWVMAALVPIFYPAFGVCVNRPSSQCLPTCQALAVCAVEFHHCLPDWGGLSSRLDRLLLSQALKPPWPSCHSSQGTVFSPQDSALHKVVTKWWFGTFWIFLYIGNVIIPTDEHSIIFQRVWLKPPTSW